MTRPNSIRGKGLQRHINDHCVNVGIPFSYKEFVRWVTSGDEYGDPVTAEWLRRRFKVSRPTMEKWIAIYKEQHNALQG